jgi:hypothetical protein
MFNSGHATTSSDGMTFPQIKNKKSRKLQAGILVILSQEVIA